MGDIEVEVEVSWWKPGAHSIIPARMSLRHDLSSSKTLCRAAVRADTLNKPTPPPSLLPTPHTYSYTHVVFVTYKKPSYKYDQSMMSSYHSDSFASKTELYKAKSGNPLNVQLTVWLGRRVFRKDGRDPKIICLTWLRNKSCKDFPPKVLQPPRPFSKLKSQGYFSFIYRWGL